MVLLWHRLKNLLSTFIFKSLCHQGRDAVAIAVGTLMFLIKDKDGTHILKT